MKFRTCSVVIALLLVFILQSKPIHAAVPVAKVYSVSVKETGAAGDGATDDSAAIQSALDLVASRPGGGIVVVPPGVYRIDLAQSLVVKSNVKLLGIHNPTLSMHNFSSSYAFGYETLSITGNRVIVDGITIEGNDSIIRGIGIHSGSSQVKVVNSTIRNISQSEDTDSPLYSALVSGILIYSQTSDVIIDHSTIDHVRAIHSNPVARGIMVLAEEHLPVAQRVKITYNKISSITPREDADGIHFDEQPRGSLNSNSLVDHNTFDHVAKRAIKIAAPGVVVSNNHIINSYLKDNAYLFPNDSPLPQDMFAGISVYADNVTVKGNLIDGTGSYYAAIEADQGTLHHINIKNNTISNGKQANIKDSNGIRIGRIHDFLIMGNTVSNMQTGVFSPSMLDQNGIIAHNAIQAVDFGVRFSNPEKKLYPGVNVTQNTILARQHNIIVE